MTTEENLNMILFHFLLEKGYQLSFRYNEYNDKNDREEEKVEKINKDWFQKKPMRFSTEFFLQKKVNLAKIKRLDFYKNSYCTIYTCVPEVLKLLNEINLRILRWLQGIEDIEEKKIDNLVFKKENIKIADLPIQIALLMKNNGYSIFSNQGLQLDPWNITNGFWSQENLVIYYKKNNYSSDLIPHTSLDFFSRKFEILLNKSKIYQNLDKYDQKFCQENLKKIIHLLETHFNFRLQIDTDNQQDLPLAITYEGQKKGGFNFQGNQLNDPDLLGSQKNLALVSRESGDFPQSRCELNSDQETENILFNLHKTKTAMQSLVDTNSGSSVLKEVYNSIYPSVLGYIEDAENLLDKYRGTLQFLESKEKEQTERSLARWQAKLDGCKKESLVKEHFSEMVEKKQEKLRKIAKIEENKESYRTQLAIIQENLDNLYLEMKNYTLHLTEEEKTAIDQKGKTIQAIANSLQEENSSVINV